jgi:predicted TIM-barrel fold metal-dependent hydrolase
MNRRQMMLLSGAALAQGAASPQMPAQTAPDAAPDTPEKLLLKDYLPESIYRVPKTEIKRAKFPVLDVHCHGAQPIDRLDAMVRTMDAAGVEKTVIFTGASTADRFEEAAKAYAKHPGRFDPWCLFDMTGANEPGFGPGAVKQLEACHAAGAIGVGELSDKGWGFRSRPAGAAPNVAGPHPDDVRMDALWERCAQLGMPVNMHVSDPIWSYQPMDAKNDGLMNGYTWRIDDKQPGILGHNGLIESLEAAVRKHPKTTFIACHLANLDYDLTRLGGMFDRNPNLYGDISARFAELAPIPKFYNQFCRKYSERILYGTDNTYTQAMFSGTFRLLETGDEHYYDDFFRTYHWPFYGAGLPDDVLKKLYRDNAVAVFRRAKSNAA